MQPQLGQLLQSEIEAMNRLKLSLEHEYDSLALSHSENLETVVYEKQNEIRELERLGKQREQLMAAMNISDTELSSGHNPFAENTQLHDLWSQLVSLAEQCRDKNRINGSIVDSVARQTKYALDILHGISPANTGNANLYDQTGHATSSSVKRTLTQV